MATPTNPAASSGGTYLPPEDKFEILTAPPAVRFLTQAVQPPSQVYVTLNDVLQVQAATSLTGEMLTLTYRLLRASDSQIVTGQVTIAPANTRAVKTITSGLAEGFLLSLSVRAAVAFTRGQTFCRVSLTQGALAGAPSYMLMSDYVTTQAASGYPNGRLLSPTEGPGYLRSVNIGSGSAGLSLEFIVPTNARWRPQSMFFNYEASAQVANRYPSLLYLSGGNFVGQLNSEYAVTASQNPTFTFAPGMQFNASLAGSLIYTSPLPDGLMLSGNNVDAFILSAIGIQTGDIIAGLNVAVEEWLENV